MQLVHTLTLIRVNIKPARPYHPSEGLNGFRVTSGFLWPVHTFLSASFGVIASFGVSPLLSNYGTPPSTCLTVAEINKALSNLISCWSMTSETTTGIQTHQNALQVKCFQAFRNISFDKEPYKQACREPFLVQAHCGGLRLSWGAVIRQPSHNSRTVVHIIWWHWFEYHRLFQYVKPGMTPLLIISC